MPCATTSPARGSSGPSTCSCSPSGFQERIDANHRDPDLPVAELVAWVAEQLVPLDDDRRAEFDVWMAMADWARDDPALEATWGQAWVAQPSLWRQLVAALHGLDPPPAVGAEHPDPLVERGALYLHMAMDGLAVQARLAPAEMPPARVRAVLRSFLADLVGPAVDRPQSGPPTSSPRSATT